VANEFPTLRLNKILPVNTDPEIIDEFPDPFRLDPKVTHRCKSSDSWSQTFLAALVPEDIKWDLIF